MNITSLNVNQFLGPVFRGELDETLAKGYILKVINILSENLNDKNDIVVLQEVPYKKRYDFTYENVYKDFEFQLKKRGMTLITPNYLGEETALFITCAVTLDETSWEGNEIYFCSKEKDELVLFNRTVEIYNSTKKMHLLGVHIPMINIPDSNGYARDMWNNIISYYNKLSKENLIIIGDMNVYEEIPYRKEKFNNLIAIGAIDSWVGMGKSPDRATYMTQKGQESRLDYALMSPTAFTLLETIDIDDDCRKGNDAYTDHSALKLSF